MATYDIVIIGGGPAGLSAALAAGERAKTLIIEREGKLGGILKQCIHDGFGVIRFGEKLSGPEYAARYIDEVSRLKNVEIMLNTFVIDAKKSGDLFDITTTSAGGIKHVLCRSVVLATGCRERTAKQIGIHGTRPVGVIQAGSAQYFVNIMGELPVKRCVILGSGDIGLIMARRLTLEGCKVLGVYEAKSTCSGLQRNVAQCLTDFSIPLHLKKTVTRVFGEARVEGVEISSVDDKMQPIDGTQEYIECDGVVLSVGLIPENETAEMFGVELENATKGAVVDDSLMTSVEGVFAAGNCLHVNDLADYVSESGEIAGKAAARYALSGAAKAKLVSVEYGADFGYVVPQKINSLSEAETVMFFRVKNEGRDKTVKVIADGKTVFKKRYSVLRPPEMERLAVRLSGANSVKVSMNSEGD